MAKLTITEKQDINSVRKGVTKDFKSIRYAKIWATKTQTFVGTVLTIEEKGRLIAYKEGGKWTTLSGDETD